MALVPIILSGGAGARLWPLSREAAPKPFLPLPADGAEGDTLLARTFLRKRPAEFVPNSHSCERLKTPGAGSTSQTLSMVEQPK